MTSPTERSLAMLREQGFTAEVVERWNPHTRTRHDLFGFADIIAVRKGEILLVQTTSYSGVSSRIKKIADCEHAPVCRMANIGIHVHGWRQKAVGKFKNGNTKYGWVCRVEDLS